MSSQRAAQSHILWPLWICVESEIHGVRILISVSFKGAWLRMPEIVAVGSSALRI